MPVVSPSASTAGPSQISLDFQRTSTDTMASAAVLRALKLATFGLNMLLILLGVMLTAGGGYCVFLLRGASAGREPASAATDPAAVLMTDAFTITIMLLTTGALLVVVGLLGCCGVTRSSRPLLLGQASAMGVLLLLQVATLAVIIWAERFAPRRAELAALELIRRRGNSIANSGSDDGAGDSDSDSDSDPAWRAVHAVQRCLHCCGVLGYGDYVSVNATIPLSCCRDENPSAETPTRCDFSALTISQLRDHPLLQRRGCGTLIRRRLHLLAALAYVLGGLTLAAQMAALPVGCYVALTMREAVPAAYTSVQSLNSRNRGFD